MSTAKRLEQLRNDFQSTELTGVLAIKLGELEVGKAVMEMPVARWFIVSENRCVQGGLTFTLADWAGVFAAMSTIESGHTYLMGPLEEKGKTKYVKPISQHEVMIARASVVKTEENIIHVEIKIYNKQEELKFFTTLLFRKRG